MKFYQNMVDLIMFLGRWGKRLLKESLNLMDWDSEGQLRDGTGVYV